MNRLLPAFAALLLASSVFGQDANLVRNGDFELFPTEWLSFNNVQYWNNRGTGGEKVNARQNNLSDGVLSSGFHASLNDRHNDRTGAFGTHAHWQETEHVIRAGDVFTLEYVWRTGSGWQRDRDVVRFVLYATTANTVSGPVVWSASLDSGPAREPGRWERISHITETVPAAAVGKKLFVMFHGVDLHGESPIGYAAVDNIVLQLVR